MMKVFRTSLCEHLFTKAQLEEIPWERQGLESIGGQPGSNSQGFHYTSLLFSSMSDGVNNNTLHVSCIIISILQVVHTEPRKLSLW